jgi:eukaryotic-like serine/threonine-protein kinase
VKGVPIENGRPGEPRMLVAGAANGQVSPNGKWLAYQIEGGDVYVQPFPGPGPRTQISTDGGRDVLWSRDGKELFFQTGDRLMAVDVKTKGSSFSAGVPHLVVHGRYRPSPNVRPAWDVSLDGKRFLRVQQVQPDRPLDRIDIALNWTAQLTGAPK